MYPLRKGVSLAIIAALTSFGAVSAIAQTSSQTNTSGTGATGGGASASTTTRASTNNSASETGASGSTSTGSAARDRNDTVHSSDSRINTTGRDTMNATQLSGGDRRFVEKAGVNNQKEVRLSRLAVERASDPRVRSFAEMMIRDHEQAGSELNSLAAQKGVSLVDQDKEDRHFRNLSEKTGAEFDQAFMAMMVKDHEKNVELFEDASRKSDDPALSALASKLLPKLQEHHRAAQDLAKSLKQ